MESSIINQKKLSATLFKAFSASRSYVYYDITKENFSWSHGGTGVRHWINRNPQGFEYTQPVESMNSDDLIRLFIEEYDKFEAEVKTAEKNGPMDNKASEIVKEASSEHQLCAAANPLIKYMKEHFHEHVKAIVTSNSVEILDTEFSVPNIDGRRK